MAEQSLSRYVAQIFAPHRVPGAAAGYTFFQPQARLHRTSRTEGLMTNKPRPLNDFHQETSYVNIVDD
jgi:hypothetical protein